MDRELQIELYHGPRELLQALFAEADDSESQIAAYKGLGEILVARRSGTIVGHAQVVSTDTPGTFELKSLAVDQQSRSQGVGSALVEAALHRCRELGASIVVVATAAASVSALKFYQRRGFRISHVIRDFYVAERGYRPLDIDGIPLLDEVILDAIL